ncbi:MAG: diguanylate cyclase [Legionella sp.]|nr:diguanylate cyclase [Legionella sp.]
MKPIKWYTFIPDVLGIFCALCGLIIVFGWSFKIQSMIYLYSDFAPMQFNTALCFIMAGLGLFTLNRKLRILSSVFSLVILFIATLTLTQYIFEINIGIDEFFIKTYIVSLNQIPGRMAPNTTIGFIIFSLSVLILNWQQPGKWLTLHAIANLFLLSLSILALIGFFSNFTTHYGVGQWIQMTLYSATAFIFLSVGLIFYLYTKNKNVLVSFVPLLICFTLLNITFLGWQSIKKNQETHLNNLLVAKVESVSSLLNIYLEERFRAFSRISYRWLSQEGGTPEKIWKADMKQYILDQPGYIAIEWVDQNYIVRWITPETGNEKIRGFNMSQESHRREQIELAINKNGLQLSNQLDLFQGGKGILLFSPLIKDNKFLGLMVGVMNTRLLLDNLIREMDLAGFKLTITDEGQVLHSNSLNQPKYKVWEKSTSISLYGQTWQISIEPAPDLFNEIMSPILPWATLLVGMFLSLLSGILTQTLISIHTLQREARDANERLQGIIEGSSDYIAAIDLDYKFIVFNSMYENEINRLFHVNLKPGMDFKVLFNKMDPENREKAQNLWAKALEGKSFTVTESFTDKYDKGLYFEIHYNPIFDANGKQIGASHIATNVYERVQVEQKLLAYRQELEKTVNSLETQNKELQLLRNFSTQLQSSQILTQIMDVINRFIEKLLPDTAGIIYLISSHYNEKVERVLSWKSPIIIQDEIDINNCFALLRNQFHIKPTSPESTTCKHVEESIEKPSSYGCFPLVVQKDLLGLMYLEAEEAYFNDKMKLTLIQMVAEKISLNIHNIQLKESLKAQSIQDSLTGLYNRRFFEAYLDKEMIKAKRYPTIFGILLLDIDHFKAINDTYGHMIGDKVLIQLAQILKHEIRESDVVARWGGEEFILYIRELTLEKVQIKAEKIRDSVEKNSIMVNGEKVGCTVSIGIALFDYELDKDLLIKKADDALYQAKNSGRNKVVVNSYDQLN